MAPRIFSSFLIWLTLFAWVPAAQGAPNPFITPKQSASERMRQEIAVAGESSVLQPFITTISQWQITIRTQMTTFAKDIRNHPHGESFWLFMLLAFAYGALHALGPGHGKVFAVSYFLNRPGPIISGLAFGNFAMFFHVLSAAIIVLGGKYFLEASMSATMDSIGSRLELVSYGMLTLIGTAFFVKVLLEQRGGGSRRRRHVPETASAQNWKGLAATTLATGIVPCPGAALVLFFSISLGLQSTGLLALLCISLGMGLTISFFAVTAILSRGRLLKVVDRHEKLFNGLHFALSLTGSLGIAVVGGLLLAWRLQA